MKRGAEKQMTREREDEDEVEETEPGTGFKKADESALAGRKIRSLPKRSMAGAGAGAGSAPAPAPVIANSTPDPAPAGRFGGFAGFGAPATGATPFTFGASAPKPAEGLTPSPFGSTFGSAPAAPAAAKPAPASAFPSVSSSASSATKTFASFLGSTTSSPPKEAPTVKETAPAPAKETVLPKESSLAKDAPLAAPSSPTSWENDPEYKYWLSLRGLNNSFLLAVQDAVNGDPFTDVAQLLDQYNNLRVGVQKEYDNSKKSVKEVKPTTLGRTPSMPTVPTGFAGFNTAPSTNGVSRTSSGGFTPSLESTAKSSSGFSFPSTAASTSTTETKDAPKEAPKSAFSFGAPSSTESKDPKPDAPKSSFGFGASTSTTSSDAPKSTSFAFGGSSDKPSTSETKSAFGGFSFGNTGSSAPTSAAAASTFKFGSTPVSPPKSLFGATDTSSGSSGAAPASIFSGGGSGAGGSSGASVFGRPTPLSAASADDDAKADAPPIASGATSLFASPLGTPFSAPSGANPFGGFARKTSGSAAGSIGNPVGFGFGSPPRTPAAGAGPLSSTPKRADGPVPFSFAPPKREEERGAEGAEERGAEGAEEEGGAPPPEQQKMFGNSEHDVEGPGEENEETVHACRVKVFQMAKGQASWADVGVGMLRLKKSKDSEARRMLLRNSSTGKLVINFALYDGLSPSLTDKIVSFVGQDPAGKSITYKLRIKTAEQAQALKEALDSELAAIKS